MVEMQALVAHDYGRPPAGLTLAQAPEPAPGAGQVLVRMRAAALNPFDLKLLSGAMRESSPLSFPYVPGMDGAGTVAALGEGVDGVAVDDEVFGFFGRTPGTVAEYAVLDVGYLARRPTELDAVHAAALPESGLTAKSLLRAVDLEPAASGEGAAAGRSVLVIGATGGIGMFAVQLARAAGARVLATAGGSGEADYVCALGAEHALDYTRGDLVAQVRALEPDGVDTVVDLVNSGDGVLADAGALCDGGRVVSPLGGPRELGRGIEASYASLALAPGDLDDLATRAARGSLRVEVSRVYPLAQAPQAFADFADSHTRGKLVVAVRAA